MNQEVAFPQALYHTVPILMAPQIKDNTEKKD